MHRPVGRRPLGELLPGPTAQLDRQLQSLGACPSSASPAATLWQAEWQPFATCQPSSHPPGAAATQACPSRPCTPNPVGTADLSF